MPKHDIVVIGASAGGLDAVRTVINGLPKKLPASMFLVIHTSPDGPGLLATILDRVGSVPTMTAKDGESIVPGHLYVAPPNAHLMLERGHMRLNRGPREHRFRPAIDPLFRTAAEHYGSRVIGVVLSGNMADGTHGLLVIKQRGGIAIVQNPDEAVAPMMPLTALAKVAVDHVLPTAEIGEVITRLVMMGDDKNLKQRREGKVVESPSPENPHRDGIEAEMMHGPPSPLTCPDCGGTLWEFKNGELLRYRCHVGHGFTAESLAEGQNGKVEDALWTALRAIEEAIELRKRMVERASQRNLVAIVPGLERDLAEYESRAEALRTILLEPPAEQAAPRGRLKKLTRRNAKKKG